MVIPSVQKGFFLDIIQNDRFIYTRYAHGLIVDESKLFEKVFYVVMIGFTGWYLLLWPFLYTISDDDLSHENTIKWRICTLNDIPDFLEEKGHLKFSVKPKLLSISISMCFFVLSLYIKSSSHKQKAIYCIPKYRQNLMDLREGFKRYRISQICLELFAFTPTPQPPLSSLVGYRDSSPKK